MPNQSPKAFTASCAIAAAFLATIGCQSQTIPTPAASAAPAIVPATLPAPRAGEAGVWYIMGNVMRPGVYNLHAGQTITLKQAIASVGNLDAVPIPRACSILRRTNGNDERMIRVNLTAILDGTAPDLFLQPDDVINLGSELVIPPARP